MRPRPVYISIIAWLYLIGAGFTVLSLAMMLLQPDRAYLKVRPEISFPVIVAQTALGSIVASLSAWKLLRGANWARWLMIAFLIESTAWAFITASIPASAWVTVLWSAIIATVLFIPPSNEFFRTRRGRRRHSRSVTPQEGAKL